MLFGGVKVILKTSLIDLNGSLFSAALVCVCYLRRQHLGSDLRARQQQVPGNCYRSAHPPVSISFPSLSFEAPPADLLTRMEILLAAGEGAVRGNSEGRYRCGV